MHKYQLKKTSHLLSFCTGILYMHGAYVTSNRLRRFVVYMVGVTFSAICKFDEALHSYLDL